MGACISGMMEKQNDKKLVPFPAYKNYSAYGKQAVLVKGTDADDRSAVYRMSNTSDDDFKHLRTAWYSGGSCLSEVEKMCKQRGSKICLAYRTLVEIEKTETVDAAGRKKSMETYVFDTKRQTMSYELFWGNIVAFGKGLKEIGLKPGDHLAIYEETRWQWINTMYGSWMADVIVATVYANLGEDALQYALNETRCAAIVCNGSAVKKVMELFTVIGNLDTKIIYLDTMPADVDPGKFELIPWGDVIHKGCESSAVVKAPAGPECDKTALIMYTSGTTGDPKGVIHSHGSLYCGVMTIAERVEDLLGPIKTEEWYCSYLPLAHIMEFAVMSVLMKRGVIVGFGSPRTLMDQFAKPHGDFTEYRPLLAVAVPRVFDTMKKTVEGNLPKPGTVKRQIFDKAYAARLKALKEGMDTPYYNGRVFGIPRKVMGGRVHAMLSGGGPLSEQTQEFINVVFGMVIQGWGLTETVCVGAIQRTGNLQYDTAGQILKTEELQLLDTEHYKHTDKPFPRGEVCLRGPFLFKGYYNQPELTKEALDRDGWFHTGDVAQVASNGAIQLIGRVKALAKNSNGEYLALETLESVYGLNELVFMNGICILVNPHRSYIAALCLTNEHLVDEFKRKNKLAGKWPEILTDPAFLKAAITSMQKTGRDQKRRSFEVVQNVMFLNEEWTVENGVLTAAMKLKRRVIDEKYEKQIVQIFSAE